MGEREANLAFENHGPGSSWCIRAHHNLSFSQLRSFSYPQCASDDVQYQKSGNRCSFFWKLFKRKEDRGAGQMRQKSTGDAFTLKQSKSQVVLPVHEIVGHGNLHDHYLGCRTAAVWQDSAPV